MQISDEEIIRQVQEGDILAFETIVKRYQRGLVSFVYRILKDEDQAYDVSQDTFIKVYKAIERIDTGRKFSTFIFEVAKNTAFNTLRKNKREVGLSEFVPAGTNEYENFFKEESRERVDKALLSLDPGYRKALRLLYFEELSYRQIGKKMNWPLNTVRTKVRRAKIALRKIIENE